MKHGKFVKENLMNKTGYVYSILFSFVLAIFLLFFSIDARGTNASFGGMTGQLSIPYDVFYYSNFPDAEMAEEMQKINTRKEYTILGNVFTVPSGYVFDSWNTARDGTGTKYVSGDKIFSEEDINLYAQWIISNIEEDEDVEGDTEFDDVIDTENNDNISSDNGTNEKDDTSDTDQDNNQEEITPDDNVDNGNSDDLENDNITSDDNDNSIESDEISNGSSSGGTGSSGSGHGGSGTGGNEIEDSNNTSNNVSGNTSNVPQYNNGDNNNNVGNDNNSDLDNNKTYVFKFVSESSEYANTSCDILEDGTCNLVLPTNNPVKEGFIFKGWSSNSMCLSNNIINSSMLVTRGGIYYACFDNILKETTISYSFIVISIWIIAFISIYFIVKGFKNKEMVD